MFKKFLCIFCISLFVNVSYAIDTNGQFLAAYNDCMKHIGQEESALGDAINYSKRLYSPMCINHSVIIIFYHDTTQNPMFFTSEIEKSVVNITKQQDVYFESKQELVNMIQKAFGVWFEYGEYMTGDNANRVKRLLKNKCEDIVASMYYLADKNAWLDTNLDYILEPTKQCEKIKASF